MRFLGVQEEEGAMISYFIIQDLSLSSVPKKIVGEGGENIQCQGYYQHHTAKKKMMH